MISFAFSVYLAKGHLDYIPDAAPLCVMGLAALYWLLVDGNVRNLAGKLFRETESPILHPHTEKPVIYSKADAKTAGLTVAVAVILIIAGFVFWGIRSDSSSRQVRIPSILIGVGDSSEHLNVQETQFVKPGNRWESNIYFNSPRPRVAFVSLSAFLFLDLPSSIDERNKLEDIEWDSTVTSLKYAKHPLKIQANVPSYITIPGPFATDMDTKKIIDHKSAVYFMAVFSYPNVFNQHQLEICVFREGNAPVIHYCHDHNDH